MAVKKLNMDINFAAINDVVDLDKLAILLLMYLNCFLVLLDPNVIADDQSDWEECTV